MSDATSGRATKRPAASQDDARFNVPLTSIHRVEADGVQVFYRMAGQADAPVVLLLHGFPTSSFMFRELIPRLASDYRVIAPDLPGFGSIRETAQILGISTGAVKSRMFHAKIELHRMPLLQSVGSSNCARQAE